jgi:hypothetical protein
MRNLSFRIVLVFAFFIVGCGEINLEDSSQYLNDDNWTPDLISVIRDHPGVHFIYYISGNDTTRVEEYNDIGKLLLVNDGWSLDIKLEYDSLNRIKTKTENPFGYGRVRHKYFYDSVSRMFYEQVKSLDDSTMVYNNWKRGYTFKSLKEYSDNEDFESIVSWKIRSEEKIILQKRTYGYLNESRVLNVYDSVDLNNNVLLRKIITDSNTYYLYREFNDCNDIVKSMVFYNRLSYDIPNDTNPFFQYRERDAYKYRKPSLDTLLRNFSYVYDGHCNWTHKLENGDTIEKRIITYY